MSEGDGTAGGEAGNEGRRRAAHYAGRALRQLRAERGWSQRTLVHRLKEAARARGTTVGVNDEMVSRWENGHRTPDHLYRTLIADVLGLAPDHWEAGVDRRRFLGVTSGVALGTLAQGDRRWELLRLLRPTRADDVVLGELHDEVEALQASYATTAPGQLTERVAAHLDAVTDLLSEPQPMGARAKLCRLGGELAGLRAWLAFDLVETQEAEVWYRLALSLASEADEPLVTGWILGGHSLVATEAGDHRRALELIQRGLARTDPATTSPTRGWLWALAGRTEAALGRPDRARRALRQAESATAPAPSERRHGMGLVGDQLLLDSHQGVALKLIDELAAAQEALDSVLADCPQEEGRRKGTAVVRLEKADLLRRGGDPDEAAHLANTALEALPDEELVGPVRSRVGRLRRDLEPWSAAPEVRRLDQLWATRTSR